VTRARIATVKGTFLVPGVSKNGRLYTREAIASAVDRMRRRLVDPDGLPLTMLSHHAAEDDSLRIAGRITAVTAQSDGSATFEADLADTDAGRDIAALTTGATPFLRSVSIRGWWLGTVRKETVNGQQVDTADDLEIDGIDFTKSPGVTGARLTDVHFAETADGHRVLTESLEAVLVTETVTPAQVFADPGYQSDGTKRLPISTAAEVRAAWGRIHTVEGYTPAQAKRIKGRIKTAAKNLGVQVAEETAQLAASVTEALEEAWASMSLGNGDADVRVDAYTPDAADLPAVGRRVALAAMAGLVALDPDMDGDVDTDPADDGSCSACASDVPPGAAFCPACGAPLSSPTGESTTTKEAPVTEQTSPPATETAPAAPEAPAVEAAPETPAAEATPDAAAPAGDAAPAAVTTETAPTGFTEAHLATLIETIGGKIDEAVEAKMGALHDKIVEAYGRPTGRRGLVKTEEAAEPAKPLHEMSPDEFREHSKSVWDSVLPPLA
jgi:hypothetical protein